ncbi:MAG: GxxExxY protein [Sumerlaeia bacterium]
MVRKELSENEISQLIVGAAIEVHKTLGGPGLLECVYEEALGWEIENRGLFVQRQLEVPIAYKGRELSFPLRLDLLVNRLVIVECKAVTQYNSIFEPQTYTYLKLMNLRLGLGVNFGEKLLKNVIHRVVNGM